MRVNKFDQIKMKVLFKQKDIEEKKKSGTFSKEDFEKWDYVDHVLHLLSRLEIAEKALEKIAKNGKTDVDGEDAENMLIMCGDIADEALQQIRE